jgi:hypothetical protein
MTRKDSHQAWLRSFVATLVLAAFALPLHAQLAPPPSAPTAPAAPTKAEPNEAFLQTHNHYVNKAGQDVHSPAKSVDGQVPSGASAKCRDGSYSFSKSRRGTCSRHGGVGTWMLALKITARLFAKHQTYHRDN